MGRAPLRGPENRSQPIKHAKACPNTLPMPICPACVCLPSLFRPPHGVGVRKEGADHDGRCPPSPYCRRRSALAFGRSGSSAATRPHARLVERAHADSRAPQLVQADTAIAVHQRAPESIGHVLALRSGASTPHHYASTSAYRRSPRARSCEGTGGRWRHWGASLLAMLPLLRGLPKRCAFTRSPPSHRELSLARSACPDPWTHARGSHPSCWSPARCPALYRCGR